MTDDELRYRDLYIAIQVFIGKSNMKLKTNDPHTLSVYFTPYDDGSFNFTGISLSPVPDFKIPTFESKEKEE